MSIIQSTVDVRNNDYNKHTIDEIITRCEPPKKHKTHCKGIIYVTAF